MITKYGNEPDQYSDQKTEDLDRKAVLKHYELISGDWFEMGGAYSLHLTFDDARKFFSPYEWYREREMREVFVSSATIERIENDKEKVVFRTWGH